MEAASPARLYATLVGALLVVLGIVGFFYSASFGDPGEVESALSVLEVNAWLNLLHIATGTLGLLLAGYASRQYALGLGAVYTVLAIWGFAIGGGDAIGGFLPASGGDDSLHLVLGLLGLAAAAGTPRVAAPRPARGKRSGSARPASGPRAKAAGEGP
jgi:Domain of unknown function (DUF4383)